MAITRIERPRQVLKSLERDDKSMHIVRTMPRDTPECISKEEYGQMEEICARAFPNRTVPKIKNYNLIYMVSEEASQKVIGFSFVRISPETVYFSGSAVDPDHQRRGLFRELSDTRMSDLVSLGETQFSIHAGPLTVAKSFIASLDGLVSTGIINGYNVTLGNIPQFLAGGHRLEVRVDQK